MALTQISTQGIKDGTITGSDLATNVDLVDNQKIRLGNSQDLEIYHDGSNSIVFEGGTGTLKLATAGGSVDIVKGANSSETMAKFIINGAVELYHDNNKKFETTSEGAKIINTIGSNVAATLEINATNGGQPTLLLKPSLSGTNRASRIDFLNQDSTSPKWTLLSDFEQNGTNDFRLVDAGQSSGNSIIAHQNGNVELYYDNNKKFETTANGIEVFNRVGVFGGTAPSIQFNSDSTGADTATRTMFGQATGNNNFINGASPNDVVLNTPDRFIIGHATNEIMAIFDPDGAVQLRHDNSTKFETTSGGVLINGDISAGDNDHLYLGDGQDINIYHDGTDSYFYLGAGTAFFRNASNEKFASFISDGAVELYHNNVKKFETTSSGIAITGGLTVSGIAEFANTINLTHASAGSNIIYFNDDLQFSKNGTGTRLKIDSTGRVGIGTTSPEEILHIKGSTETIGSRDGVMLQHSTASNSADNGLPLVWSGYISSSNTNYGLASICGRKENGTDNNGAAYLQFGTGNSAGAISEHMRINSKGQISITGTTSTFDTTGDINGLQLYYETDSGIATIGTFSDGGATGIDFHTNSGGGPSAQRMRIDHLGNIGAPNGTNIYNASDSRVKTNVVDLDKGLSAIKSLRPVSFNWIDGFCDEEKDTLYGFIAQEVKAVDSNLIQDFATELIIDNNKIENVLRVNEKFIIPILVKAVQELSAKVETLKTEVASLKAS